MILQEPISPFELRQQIRDELWKMDKEYRKVNLGIEDSYA